MYLHNQPVNERRDQERRVLLPHSNQSPPIEALERDSARNMIVRRAGKDSVLLLYEIVYAESVVGKRGVNFGFDIELHSALRVSTFEKIE